MNHSKQSIALKVAAWAAWMVIALFIAGLLLLAYYNVRSRMSGRTANAQIEIDASVIFAREDIESAINVAMNDFAGRRDSWNELLKISYNEDYSNTLIGHRNWDAGNAIVLIASYQSNSAPGSNRPTIVRRWEWALFRDISDGTWRVAYSGKVL